MQRGAGTRGVRAIGAAAVVAMTLVGCAALTPATTGLPSSRAAVDCSNALSPLTDILGEGTVFQPDWVTTDIREAAAREAGILECTWQAPSPDATTINIRILSDAGTTFKSGGALPKSDTALRSSINAGSELGCRVDPVVHSAVCDASVLSAGYWLAGTLQIPPRVSSTAPALQEAQKVFAGVAMALVGLAPPGPAWNGPSTAWPGVSSSGCAALDPSGKVPEALADVGVFKLAPVPAPSTPDPLAATISSRTQIATCLWKADKASLAVTVLPGALWAQQAVQAAATQPVRQLEQDATMSRSCTADGVCTINVFGPGGWVQLEQAGIPSDDEIQLARTVLGLLDAR